MYINLYYFGQLRISIQCTLKHASWTWTSNAAISGNGGMLAFNAVNPTVLQSWVHIIHFWFRCWCNQALTKVRVGLRRNLENVCVVRSKLPALLLSAISPPRPKMYCFFCASVTSIGKRAIFLPLYRVLPVYRSTGRTVLNPVGKYILFVVYFSCVCLYVI